MISRQPSKHKDPIGTAVFYPNSLPPPPRRPSRGSSSALPNSEPPPGISPVIPPRASSLQPLEAAKSSSGYDDATEFPFPHQSPSEHSPPARLTSMLESWNLFTPSPCSGADQPPGLFAADSAPDLSLLSPNALALSDLIDEAYIEHGSSPSHAFSFPNRREKPTHIDSPAPHAGLHLTSPLRRASGVRAQGGFYLGSPPALPPSPSVRPIPFRQPSWSATGGPRRASVPNVSVQIQESALASSSYQPPSTLYYPTRPASKVQAGWTGQPDCGDVFSPDYSLAPTHVLPSTQYTFPPRGPDQNLHVHLSDLATPLTHQYDPSHVSPDSASDRSRIAAHHLQDRILNHEFVKRYDIRDELGSGGFGFVCSAIQTGYQNQAGVEVAVKFIFKNRITQCDYATINGEPVESYVLSRCEHPNIIRFYDLFEDPEFWYLVQELHGDPWAPGHTLDPKTMPPAPSSVPGIPVLNINPALISPGSVFSQSPASSDWTGWSPSPRMKRPDMARRASHDLFEAVEHRRFTEDQARTIFRQILSAVSYLHQKGIYHRDLKDENIVVDRNLTVKIIDFGSAVFENRLCPPVLHDHFRGTLSYAAAEVLNGSTYLAGPVDIWALGIILGIILTGESPFPDASFAQIGHIKMKRPVSADAYDLLARCLHTNPTKRATVQTLAMHRWLRIPKDHRGSV